MGTLILIVVLLIWVVLSGMFYIRFVTQRTMYTLGDCLMVGFGLNLLPLVVIFVFWWLW